MSAPVLEAVLDDLRVGLRRRAARRRARAALAGTAAAVVLALAVVSGFGTARGTAPLTASSGADATVLLRGCTGSSAALACTNALRPGTRF